MRIYPTQRCVLGRFFSIFPPSIFPIKPLFHPYFFPLTFSTFPPPNPSVGKHFALCQLKSSCFKFRGEFQANLRGIWGSGFTLCPIPGFAELEFCGIFAFSLQERFANKLSNYFPIEPVPSASLRFCWELMSLLRAVVKLIAINLCNFPHVSSNSLFMSRAVNLKKLNPFSAQTESEKFDCPSRNISWNP